ncbi:MAG: fibronectin type III domain-containing protein [Patescibacteria group bacterium]
MKSLASILFLIAISPLLSLKAEAADPIPAEFQPLHTVLESKLDTFLDTLKTQWNNGSVYPTVIGSSLIPLNPNFGDTLLVPAVFTANIKYMDRLQSLGVRGLAIDINYPLLDPNFRGATTSNLYLSMYKNIMDAARQRGFTVSIEVQPIFPNYSTLPVTPYYQSMTLNTYKLRYSEMLKTIAIQLKPDYLSVDNEPDTAATNTGFPVDNITTATQMTAFYLSELKNLGLSNIKYGSGFGTWQQNYMAWTNAYTDLANLDFLNIHIYPIDSDLLTRSLSIISTAQQKGKKVIEHEAWLNKWQVGDAVNAATSKAIFARNVYTFWQPLDQKFLTALTAMARTKQMDFISPFWSMFYFGGYMDYSSAASLSDDYKFTESIKQGIAAATANNTTSVGSWFTTLIQSSSPFPPIPDTILPSIPTNLVATPISSSQINLSWSASTDNVGVTGYKIYRSGNQIGTSANTSYSDTGLSPSTAYTYTVSAYDAAGNTSAQSSSASATTLAPNEPPPPNPTPVPTPTPPPNPTPTPTPIPPPTKIKFSIGQRVQTTSNLDVKALPFISGTLLGTKPIGALGTVVFGGISIDGFLWWNVNYDSGIDGWSVENYLQSYPTSTTQPIKLTKHLYRGIQDPQVEILQRFLISKGYLSIGLNTGYFGTLTMNAVRRFQCEYSIICSGSESDGYGQVGPRTRASLNPLVR